MVPVNGNPHSSSQHRVDSVFDAIIGLANLGAPKSPIREASPSPSVEAAQGGSLDPISGQVTTTQLKDQVKMQVEKQIPGVILPPSRLNAVPMTAPMTVHNTYDHHRGLRPPATLYARPLLAPRPAYDAPYQNPLPPYPLPARPRAGAPLPPMSQGERFALAAAMDRFDRVAAMERAAAARPQSYPCHHDRYHMAPPPPPRQYPPYTQNLVVPAPVAPIISLPAFHHTQRTTEETVSIPNKNFPEILYDVISSDAYSDIIMWLPHGKGFIIHDKQRFSSLILPMFFDGAKFTSFTRRLKRWNFVRVAKGVEMGAYYNKEFERDGLDAVQRMKYKPEDGKFDEAKKKCDEKEKNADKEEEIKEEQEEEKMEEEIKPNDAKSLPDKKESHKPKNSPMLKSQESKVPSPEAKPSNSADPQAVPALGGSFPKQPVDADAAAAVKTHEAVPPPSNKIARNQLSPPTVANQASTLQMRGYPGLVTPNDLDQQRLRVLKREEQLRRLERETQLSRPMYARNPHEVLRNPRLAPPAGSVAAMPSRPIAPVGAMSHHPYHPDSAAAIRRMFEVEHARRILEVEHAHYDHLLGPGSMAHGAAALREPHYTRLQPPFIQSATAALPSTQGSFEAGSEETTSTQSSQHAQIYPDEALSNKKHQASKDRVSIGGVGGGRSIMMSKQEQEEFAEYLFMKRESMKALREKRDLK